MPSIEVACIGLTQPVRLEAQGFVLESGLGLRAQRLPASFQPDFAALTGCLYRLGKRAVREPPRGASVAAYELLSVGSREPFPPSFLEFSPEHVGEVRRVVAEILAASPLGRVLFTSDWQFGPEWTHRFGPLTLAEFWSLHDSRALYLNTAYALEQSAT